MRVIIKHPDSEIDMQLNAHPERLDGEDVWRIVFPAGDSIRLCQRNDNWEVIGQNIKNFSMEYIQELGKAIKPTHENTLISGDRNETDNATEEVV